MSDEQRKTKQEKFVADMLLVSASQNEKIEKLADLLADNAKNLADLVVLIKEGKQAVATEQKQEATYIIFTTSTQPVAVMPKGEFQKRTEEVITLIKPILVKYGIAQLNAFLVEQKKV